MADLVIGNNPAPITSYQPKYDRQLELGNGMVVTMKAAPTLHAGSDHNIGFSVTDSGGFDIPLGKYLQENAHINIISPDAVHYHHLHTNYGMIGTDGHGAGAAHSHSSLPWPAVAALVNVAQAQSDGHTDHSHGSAAVGEDAIQFNEKDLRILFNFPTVGKYKIFVEFVTAQNPTQVKLAEFWVDVGQPLVESGPFSNIPKWVLVLLSILIISAVMPFIFKYLNEEKINVK
jgi:hypothetical protein